MKRVIALCSNVNQFHEFKITHFTDKLQQKTFRSTLESFEVCALPFDNEN